MRSRRVRRLHGADRRCAALLVFGARAPGTGQEGCHHRRARRPGNRKAERGPAGRRRRAGLPVRVLHARVRDGRDRLSENEPESDAAGTGARCLRQPVPVPGLRQDSHGIDARRGIHAEGLIMAASKLVGQNYTTPDLIAKVTGQAKYAEDFRVEGMLFARLLTSPMPHAKVKSLNLSAALAMPGVKAIITADDIPAPAATVTDLGQTIQANLKGERALTNEPMYQGEPVLAVAAVDELTAVEAIEKIEIE